MANLDDLLLASSSGDIHDVDHDPNSHDVVANDTTRLLDALPNDDPTLPLRRDRGIQDEAVQKCCKQRDVEVQDDVCLVLIHSPLVLHC